jgi:hypothetical protein
MKCEKCSENCQSKIDAILKDVFKNCKNAKFDHSHQMKWNIELLANVFGLFGFLVRLAEPELVGGVPVLHEHANDLVTLSLQQDCGHCKGTKICLSKNVCFFFEI